MGQIFELIADSALTPLDDYYTECHVCDSTGIGLYAYQGRHYLADGTVDDDIYAVCASCILTEKLAHSCDFEYIKTIDQYISRQELSDSQKSALSIALIAKYQHTPGIPLFMQYEDRPLCCNDITEFTGHPTDREMLYHKTENSIYWEKMIRAKPAIYNFRNSGSPENFRDVALFKCRHCKEQYFTFQFT